MAQISDNSISLKLDQHVVRVVSETFSYMLNNYHITGVIDHAAWIIAQDELAEIISLFRPHLEAGRKVRVIRLKAKQYDTFLRLLDYAGFAAPKQADRAVLEVAYEAYLDSGGGNQRMMLILAFDADELAAVVSVFNKMIADPGAIDGSMYDLTEWDDFEALVSKLNAARRLAEALHVVPMNFGEWVTYSSYISHVYDLDEEDLTKEECAVVDEMIAENGFILRNLDGVFDGVF